MVAWDLLENIKLQKWDRDDKIGKIYLLELYSEYIMIHYTVLSFFWYLKIFCDNFFLIIKDKPLIWNNTELFPQSIQNIVYVDGHSFVTCC